MSGIIDFGDTAEEQNNTIEAPEDTEIPFEANESTEGYALGKNGKSLCEAISTDIFGNASVYDEVDYDWNEHGLEDFPDFDTDHLTGQQTLSLLWLLFTSTFGKRQRDLNEGYGMGWDTSGDGPPVVYDNDEVEHVPYLDVYSDLPAFDHYTLDAEEIEELESEGLDMNDFGFDGSVEGPQLPLINGERLPVLFNDGDEVERFINLVNTIGFDEVTYCPEGGELQGTPSLGPDNDSVENMTDGDSDSNEEVYKLAYNPEQVTEVTVNDLKGQGPEEHNVSNINSEQTLKTMLKVEKGNGNRSTAISRIESKLDTVQEDASQDEVEEAVEDTELSDIQETYGFSDMEIDAVQFRVETGKAEDYQEAASQIAA